MNKARENVSKQIKTSNNLSLLKSDNVIEMYRYGVPMYLYKYVSGGSMPLVISSSSCP
jgi:hypothetical protein